MERKVLIYNNNTGIAERMEPLLAREGLSMLVSADIHQLKQMLDTEKIHLMLIDVELNDKGKGLIMGTSVKMFSVVGPVVVNGIVWSAVAGIINMLVGGA